MATIGKIRHVKYKRYAVDATSVDEYEAVATRIGENANVFNDGLDGCCKCVSQTDCSRVQERFNNWSYSPSE